MSGIRDSYRVTETERAYAFQSAQVPGVPRTGLYHRERESVRIPICTDQADRRHCLSLCGEGCFTVAPRGEGPELNLRLRRPGCRLAVAEGDVTLYSRTWLKALRGVHLSFWLPGEIALPIRMDRSSGTVNKLETAGLPRRLSGLGPRGQRRLLHYSLAADGTPPQD
ncbi:unnamed protein product [Lota lota]